MHRINGLVSLSVVAVAVGASSAAAPNGAIDSKLVYPGLDTKLTYVADENGNTLLDFSDCGFGGGGVKLPAVAVKATVDPQPGDADDTARIQNSIDEVSKLPLNQNGLRGAVLLTRGQYRIAGNLTIAASGVVLRGEGQDENGTVLVATGKGTRVLIQVRGTDGAKELVNTRQKVVDEYVPVGARKFRVDSAAGFRPGDSVLVRRIGNAAWIREIKMDQIMQRPVSGGTRQWSPFALDFDRVIVAIDGNTITVDAPIACAMDAKWGGGEIVKYEDPGRIEHVGVENLRGDTEFDPSVTQLRGERTILVDERHARGLLSLANVKNAWAQDLTAIHFYHGVVDVRAGAKWITVQDSSALDPVSQITGGRRYPFSIAAGQLVLVQRCHSKAQRHAFVFGSRVCGPNVFLDCHSEEDYATSEPHHRWSVGGLYDNVRAQLAFQDRQYMGSGHGWAGANYVAWNCQGSLVCQQPPTAQNYAIGFVGQKKQGAFEPRPDGYWESLGQHVTPRSLYLKQLEDRLGIAAVANTERK